MPGEAALRKILVSGGMTASGAGALVRIISESERPVINCDVVAGVIEAYAALERVRRTGDGWRSGGSSWLVRDGVDVTGGPQRDPGEDTGPSLFS